MIWKTAIFFAVVLSFVGIPYLQFVLLFLIKKFFWLIFQRERSRKTILEEEQEMKK